jgi:hypothetical protein
MPIPPTPRMPDPHENRSQPPQPTMVRCLVATTTPRRSAVASTSTAGPSMPTPHRPFANIVSPQLVPRSSLTIADLYLEEDDYGYNTYEDYNWEAWAKRWVVPLTLRRGWCQELASSSCVYLRFVD